MTGEIKLLRAFIEASGYEVEEVMSECMPVESDITVLAKDYKIDYKVTKKGCRYLSVIKDIVDGGGYVDEETLSYCKVLLNEKT